MLIRYTSMAFAAALLAAPMAMAQSSSNPTGNMGSNRSMTASPGTADSTSASGMRTGDVKSGVSNYGGSSSSMGMTSSGAAGSTGHTVVPGNNSSASADRNATVDQRTSANQAGSGNGGSK